MKSAIQGGMTEIRAEDETGAHYYGAECDNGAHHVHPIGAWLQKEKGATRCGFG